jgi:hypothetical protein
MKGLIEDWLRNMYQRCWNDAIAYRQFVERRNVQLPVFAFLNISLLTRFDSQP